MYAALKQICAHPSMPSLAVQLSTYEGLLMVPFLCGSACHGLAAGLLIDVPLAGSLRPQNTL